MGKGYGSTTIPVQAGIIVDLNRLYRKFKQKNSLRLVDFCEVFREMGMNEIWKGRQSSAELIEFSEKLLQLCSTYMCSFRQREAVKTGDLVAHSLDERIFGVYCTYGFYYLQPSDYVTQIRVTQDDFIDIGEFFEQKLVPDRHLDAACCLYKLIDAGAFRIVPFKNSYDPSFHRRYDVPDCEEIVTEFADEPFSLVSEIANDPILKHIGIIQEKYDKMKITHLPNARPGRNLFEALNELVEKEKTSFIDERIRAKTLISEDVDATNAHLHNVQNGEDPLSQKSSKNALKHRAYGSGIRYTRNRRYADPEIPANLEDDVNEKNIFKKKELEITEEREEELVEEDDFVVAMRALEETTPKRHTRSSAKRRVSVSGENAKKKMRNEEDEMEEVENLNISLSRKEGRKRAAQKRATQKKINDAIAAGELPPLDEPEMPGAPKNPVEMLTDPIVQNELKTPRIAIEADPELAEFARSYKTTNEEMKAMQAVEELIGNTPSTSKAKTTRSNVKRTRSTRSTGIKKTKKNES